MPIYDYVCRDCEEEFELLVRGSETPECASCGSPQLTKLLSVPAAHVAGGTPSPAACESPLPAGPCGMGTCGLPQCGG